MAFMLGSCQQKLQAEPAKSNNLFSTLLGKSEAEVLTVYGRTSSEYVQRLWDVQPPTGKWRYYVGMVYFLSMLHISGNFTL